MRGNRHCGFLVLACKPGICSSSAVIAQAFQEGPVGVVEGGLAPGT
jgi:hypothetical protein